MLERNYCVGGEKYLGVSEGCTVVTCYDNSSKLLIAIMVYLVCRDKHKT